MIDKENKSQLIDKYFIPHEIEKKSNTEVSTSFQLRQEMLENKYFFYYQLKNLYIYKLK